MKMMMITCSLCALVPLAGAVRAVEPFFVVPQDDFYTTVTNTELELERPLIDGALRKTGGGLLTLHNPRIPSGELDVLAGGVAVSFTDTLAPPALPAALQQKAAFWVDANTNVVTDGGGNVERWHDVREPDVNGPGFQYMMATNDIAVRRPELVSDPALGGKNYLDFKKWQTSQVDDGRYLIIATSNGVLRTGFGLRTVFIVFGSHNGNVNGGSITLIQNHGSGTPVAAPWAPASQKLWASTANTRADKSMNWLDREMAHGDTVKAKPNTYQLINVATLESTSANTIGKDRELPQYYGGVRICEMLLFTEELTEAERLQAEDYLWSKWLARDDSGAGAYTLEDGATLDFGLDATNHTAAVSGAGTVSKTGAGALVLGNSGTGAFDGTVRLREGSLLTAGEPYLFDLEEGGLTLDVKGSLTQNIPNPQASDTVTKTGAGELAVASVSPAIAKLAATEGTLRLAAPRVPPAPRPSDAAVNDPGLESFVLNTPSTDPARNPTPASTPISTVNGWTFDRSAYSTGNLLVGIVFDDSPSPYITYPLIDGHAALYINLGTASTTFTVPASGHYRLSFEIAARNAGSFVGRNVHVQVDGVTLRTVTAFAPPIWRHAYRLPWLATGQHTIGFEGFDPTNGLDKVAILDNIRIEAIAAAETAPVTAPLINPSFEMPATWLDANIVVTNAAATWSDGGWTFENQAGLGRIQKNTSTRSMPSAIPDGIAAGILTSNGVIRQTVTFPEAGRYLLTFSAAGRLAMIGHTFEVRLGGECLTVVTTPDTHFRTVETPLPQVSANESLELAFVGVAGGSPPMQSLIDDVRIERVSDAFTDPVVNGGFEMGGDGWAFSSFAGVTNSPNPWNVAAPGGTNLAYLAMAYTFTQNIPVGQDGSYALRFLSQSYTYSAIARYHDFDVLWDGQRLGRFVNVPSYLYSVTVPLPTVASGSTYTLQIKGVDSYGAESGSCFDNFSITPYTPRPRRSPEGRFPKTTVLDIADGATLALDFDGEIKIATVRYAGRIVSGTINAATRPEFVTGTGSIKSPERGTLFSIQ